MNSICVLSFVLALAAYAHGAAYGTAHDGFDMKAAVQDIEILKGLIGCLIDTHPCNEITTEFKKNFPDAVTTACTKCTDQQKSLSNIFIEAVKVKLPTEYEALKKKYDPEGKHFSDFEANVANH